jgi:predicted kinase
MPPSAYSPEFYARTYDTLLDEAGRLLNAGRAVVLDATFIDAGLRGRAERLAAQCGVPFEGVWLDAPGTMLEARVAERIGDASDATLEVLQDQIERLARTRIDWPRLDAAQPVEVSARAWAARRVASAPAAN